MSTAKAKLTQRGIFQLHSGQKDILLIQQHFLHVANMQNLHVLMPQNSMHVFLTWAGTAHMLG